jgi:hypothetical protein
LIRVLAGPGPGRATTAAAPDAGRTSDGPMRPNTIRGIHSILSSAFAAAQRWDWVDPVPEVDRRAAAYLSRLTADAAPPIPSAGA